MFIKSVLVLILVIVFLLIQAKNIELLWKTIEIDIYEEASIVTEIT